jgi:hypothetical protein
VLTGLAAARASRANPLVPHKLAGIVTFAGSAYVHPGISADPNEFLPSWRFGATPLPTLSNLKMLSYSSENLIKAIDAAPRNEVEPAELPIEGVQVPLLVFGADADRIWPSGEFARRIAARAKATQRESMVRVVTYPNSGHRLLGPGPSLPSETYKWDGGSFTAHYGGTDAGNLAARNAAWDEFLTFLAASDRAATPAPTGGASAAPAAPPSSAPR